MLAALSRLAHLPCSLTMSQPPISPQDHAERLQTEIRLQHLRQLQIIPVSEKGRWNGAAAALPSYFQYMRDWSEKGKEQICAAIAAKATGGHEIDWNVALYAFMESAAVYLRDWPTLFLASQAAREGRTEEALQLLADSDAEIRRIASMWHPDLHYVTICDLVEEHPDSDPTLDGPFCGVFFSTNPHTPFIGIVFKGTHVESWEEMLVDLRYIPVESTGGRLWDTHVSQGIFATLFGPFPKLGGQTPFDYIQRVVNLIASGNGNLPTDVHITGHSLGASYASLFYAEQLRLAQSHPSTSNLVLRDLYTYGSPRVALGDFVDAVDLALRSHAGHAWRICSIGDPVTLVPPALLTDPKFIHLDVGYRVAEDQEPVRLETERRTHPRPPLPLINMSNHTPWAYFDSLFYTATNYAAHIRKQRY
ncbi:alpha/beta-hydrolase [Trametopsis cervina]|nr:alpha/beta-hydrolase [Trametopsis cervina]